MFFFMDYSPDSVASVAAENYTYNSEALCESPQPQTKFTSRELIPTVDYSIAVSNHMFKDDRYIFRSEGSQELALSLHHSWTFLKQRITV